MLLRNLTLASVARREAVRPLEALVRLQGCFGWHSDLNEDAHPTRSRRALGLLIFDFFHAASLLRSLSLLIASPDSIFLRYSSAI